MRRILLPIVLFMAAFPALSYSQQSGTFVGSLGIGLTSAQSDFADTKYFSAGSGFGAEAQLRFYPVQGLALGGFVNYMRFGSSYDTNLGRVSFNFSQIGGLAQMNLINLSNGRIFVSGGGGMFTPNVRFYVPDSPVETSGDKTGNFFFGGFGISSMTDQYTIYEIEARYNVARADFTLNNTVTSNVFDFIYVGVKLSFASKGKEAPRGY